MEDLKPSAANSSPLTPLWFLDQTATVYGDCPSVVYGDTAYTWSETRLRCLKVASSLVAAGIGPGDVVSVVAPNVPAMYELQFAVPMSGAILNCINTRLDNRTVSVLLCHAESKLVFVDRQFLSLVLEAVSLNRPADHPMLVLIDSDEELEGANEQMGLKEMSSRTEFKGTYESMVLSGDPSFQWIRPESEWAPMVLNYTSGTTSSPKGVVHCHRSLFTMSVGTLVEVAMPKQPIYLWTLPMFHSNGWSLPWGIAAVGGTNICLRKFDAPLIYRLIEQHGVTHMCGAPIVLNMLSGGNGSGYGDRPLKAPVHIVTAGAPPPAAVLRRTESLGFKVSHGYGLTEVAGIVVSCAWKPQWDRLSADERARLKARQGVRTLCMTAVDVVDPKSRVPVKRDGLTLGEIVLKGSAIMLGYLKDPEGTANCMDPSGWLYTGDVAVIHPDGYLEIKDRSKDVIISGGENLSSIEVESVLYAHPAVNEAAVVARPDEYWGETPCAFVSLKTMQAGQVPPTETDIIAFCRANMPHYMVPKTVVFNDELPKTSTGKIQKYLLRGIAESMGSPRSRM